VSCSCVGEILFENFLMCRHAVAACYGDLKAVLPIQDIIAEDPEQDEEKMEMLQDTLISAKNNKTTTLNRARYYIIYLESILSKLLKENSMQSVGHSSFDDGTEGKSSTLTAVRQDFCHNFHCSKSIEQYKVNLFDQQREKQMPMLKKVDCSLESNEDELTYLPLQDQAPCHSSSTTFNSSLFATNAIFVPVMFATQPKQFASCSSKERKTNIDITSFKDASIDLGFVSAENASSQSSLDDEFCQNKIA